MCGLNNVTKDLNKTNIKVLRANSLHCELGISITLFCDDMKDLFFTSLVELHLESETTLLEPKQESFISCQRV